MYYAQKPVIVERYQLTEVNIDAIANPGPDTPEWLVNSFNYWQNKRGKMRFRIGDWLIYNINTKKIDVIGDKEMNELYELISVMGE